MEKWTAAPLSPQAKAACSWTMLKECLSALPPSWQASTIKTVVGGWTTERRVRQINIPCKFGCPSECDTQKH
eukprot:4722340-Pyramimonas_sp.AAC.1